MQAKRILFITQEMIPFVPSSVKADFGKNLPQAIQELNHEIRTFTPKWGIINERRNQLHEVIRLSGMNIIIDETDHPLIIKVASLPQARMQIYFIDNDDYFMKRNMAFDDKGEPYSDNGERAVFYARGVLETVKKLRWVPDVIHCSGWISAITPLYIKKAFDDEPAYSKCKVVYSASSPDFKMDFGKRLIDCIKFKNIVDEDLTDIFNNKFGYEELQKLAVHYADAVVLDDDGVGKNVIKYAKQLNKPILEPQDKESFSKAYSDFYESLMEIDN